MIAAGRWAVGWSKTLFGAGGKTYGGNPGVTFLRGGLYRTRDLSHPKRELYHVVGLHVKKVGEGGRWEETESA